MAHVLPSLTLYAFNALEPHIDALTMEIHSQRHHKAYVDNLNKALMEGQAALQSKSIDELLRDIKSVPETIRRLHATNGGGHANHSIFWTIMASSARRQADRPIGRRDRQGVRRLRGFPSENQGKRPRSVRQRLGLARPGRRQAASDSPAESGQPAHGGVGPAVGRRRVGTRVLFEVSEQTRRLRGCLVEHGKLGGRDGTFWQGEGRQQEVRDSEVRTSDF